MDFNFNHVIEALHSKKTHSNKIIYSIINQHLDTLIKRAPSKNSDAQIEDSIDFYIKTIKTALRLINDIKGDSSSEINRTYYEHIIDIVNDRLEELMTNISYYIHSDPFNLGNHSNKFVYYPALLDNDFAKKLISKQEFLMNIGHAPKKSIRHVYKGFKKSPVQRLVKNYISTDTPYNGILLWHEVGVGKTCAAIGIAENFKKRIYTKKERTIILTPGQTLKDSWYDEIFNIKKEITYSNTNYNKQCTGESYIHIMNKDSTNYNRVKRRRDKIISKYYEVDGYQAFAGKFTRDFNDYLSSIEDKNRVFYNRNLIKFIKENFSNRVMILDEVHTTRDTNNNSSLEGKKIRKYLELIVRYSDNLKLILLSATPMYDSASEIIWLINLLRLNDNRSPLDYTRYFKDFKVTNPTEFSSKIKGYISYQRGEDPYIFPTKLWPSINNSDKSNLFIPATIDNLVKSDLIKMDDDSKKFNFTEEQIKTELSDRIRTQPVLKNIFGNNTNYISQKYSDNIKHLVFYRNFMSNWQYGCYCNYLDNNPDAGNFSGNTSTRQYSNIVLPQLNREGGLIQDQIVPNNNFNNLFPKKKGKYTINDALINSDGISILNKTRIGKYSKKLENILNIIENSKGIVFIYSKFIEFGALITALALEENGFSKFNCNSKGETSRKTLLTNSTYKAKRKFSYILLTGQPDLTGNKTTLNKLKDFSNSIQNKNGDIIKVIIGTEVVEQGISFFNVRQIHMLDPWWNINSYNQVIGRGVRRLSHKNLPKEERNVTIYLHLGVKSHTLSGGGKKNKLKKLKKIKKINKKETLIDEYLYSRGLSKYNEILKVQRIMKQFAFDCNLNKKANIFTGLGFNEIIRLTDARNNNRFISNKDWDGSITCDFGVCNYTCSPDINIEGLDTNQDTYNLNLIKEDIMIAKQIIKDFFKKTIGTEFNQLRIRVKPLLDIKDKSSENIDNIISLSLHTIIKNKEPVYNDIIGKSGYISEILHTDRDGKNNNYYIFQKQISEKTDDLKYVYLPEGVNKKHLSIKDIDENVDFANNTTDGTKSEDGMATTDFTKLMNNFIGILQLAIFNSLIMYNEDAKIMLGEQLIPDLNDVYNKFKEITHLGNHITHKFPKTSGKKISHTREFIKFGYNILEFGDYKDNLDKILLDRKIKLFGSETNTKHIGDFIKLKNARVSRIDKQGKLKGGVIIEPRKRENMGTPTKKDFIQIQYDDRSIETLVFNGSVGVGEKKVDLTTEYPITNRFYDGTMGSVLPNIYDIIYNIFLTEIENRSLSERNSFLKKIFDLVENKPIEDYIDTYFFYKENKVKHSNQKPYRIDFSYIDNNTYLHDTIIKIFFYSYFSSRDLNVKIPNSTKILKETHNFNKFSYFLTDKMYNKFTGTTYSGTKEKIKYLVIPTSSIPPKAGGISRIGSDSYDFYEKDATGKIIKKSMSQKLKTYLNRTFFPNPDDGNLLKSKVYSFIYSTSISAKGSSFYVVNKGKDNYTEVTTKGTGRISKKVDRTGAPCGNAKGVKKNIEIGTFVNDILTKLALPDKTLIKYGDLGKRWPLYPSKEDLCMELKLLMRHLDHLGYIDHSVAPKKPLNVHERYFYHEHVKNKIDRSL